MKFAACTLSILLFSATLTACSSAGSASPSSGGLTSGTQPVTIADPSLNNMKAGTLTIPAGWKFQGVMLTSACNPLPFPVFRAYSPDGLTEMRALPVFGWKWGRFKNPNDGCLPLTGPMSAADFLRNYTEMIPGGVHIVGPLPVSTELTAFKDRLVNSANASRAIPGPGPHLTVNHTGDVAAIRVQTVNGSFVIEQRLRALLICDIRPDDNPMQGGTCWVRVDVLRAPKGKLDALIALVDGQNLPHFVQTQEWMQASLQRQQQQGQAMLRELAARAQAASRMLYQQHEQFMQTMQHNHEAFMAQQESSFRSSMNNANAAMNARTTAASDWVDYALDQQTVVGQGGYAKVSSAYSQTWSSTVGNQTTWYQTNDPNANPNGVLSGNWTPDTKVHGNGQPYE
jgi:hypothetical protein